MNTTERYNHNISEFAIAQAKAGNKKETLAWARHLMIALAEQAK